MDCGLVTVKRIIHNHRIDATLLIQKIIHRAAALTFAVLVPLASTTLKYFGLLPSFTLKVSSRVLMRCRCGTERKDQHRQKDEAVPIATTAGLNLMERGAEKGQTAANDFCSSENLIGEAHGQTHGKSLKV